MQGLSKSRKLTLGKINVIRDDVRRATYMARLENSNFSKVSFNVNLNHPNRQMFLFIR